MRKPRISWDTEFECYCCMYEDDCFLGWPKVGTGATVKEAFVDWYVKQFEIDGIDRTQLDPWLF